MTRQEQMVPVVPKYYTVQQSNKGIQLTEAKCCHVNAAELFCQHDWKDLLA